MKKQFIYFIFLFVIISLNAQISIGSSHKGKLRPFPKGRLSKFKNTQTIFVLSNVIDRERYEQILKKSWDVTPYKLIDQKNFNLLDYKDDNYSFANLEGFKTSSVSKNGVGYYYLYLYVNFFMLNPEGLNKDMGKLRKGKKNYDSKFKEAISSNKENIARFYLFPKAEFASFALSFDTKISAIVDSIYNKDVFYNYKPGFLKNYIQKVNSQLKQDKEYWMYESDFLPELKNLSEKTLYIPRYHFVKYDPFSQTEKIEKSDFEELFENYAYKFKFIDDDDEMNERILKSEEFYYLRYARINSQNFIHIINSKTGEIIYRDYSSGIGPYNIKKKHIKKLNKSIKKSLK